MKELDPEFDKWMNRTSMATSIQATCIIVGFVGLVVVIMVSFLSMMLT